MKHFKLNSKVKINSENENYNTFRGKILIVTHVAKNANEHPGYDKSVSPDYLYDLKTIDGEDVPFSLYDYELLPA